MSLIRFSCFSFGARMLPVRVLLERRTEEGSAAFRAAGGREAKAGDLAFAGALTKIRQLPA